MYLVLGTGHHEVAISSHIFLSAQSCRHHYQADAYLNAYKGLSQALADWHLIGGGHMAAYKVLCSCALCHTSSL